MSFSRESFAENGRKIGAGLGASAGLVIDVILCWAHFNSTSKDKKIDSDDLILIPYICCYIGEATGWLLGNIAFFGLDFIHPPKDIIYDNYNYNYSLIGNNFQQIFAQEHIITFNDPHSVYVTHNNDVYVVDDFSLMTQEF